MAGIKEDIVRSRIEVVGVSEVKNSLLDIEKSIDDLNRSNKDLREHKKLLVAAGKEETQEYTRITEAIKKNNTAIDAEKKQRRELNSEIKLSEKSYNQLRATQTELKRELNKTSKELTPTAWYKYRSELDQVEKQLVKVHTGMAQTSTIFSKTFKQVFSAVSIGNLASSALTKISSNISQSVDKYTEFDDKLADVMKTTGLTKDEVEELNQELKKIDTRTGQMELLDLARVAGKLGIDSSKDVEGFVRAADKINVALSEDLGGNTEEAINQIGKLVDIFGIKDTYGLEDSMIKIGSAINEAGAASTANEGYIVEFAKRVAGVAPSAGVSIQNIIGLGATLDQLGQASEVSSTAYTQAITGMFKKTEIYAQIAGVSLQNFTTLMNTDANAAFKMFLQGLGKNNTGMAELAANLDSLGMDGTRATTILGTLAKNIDILEQQQSLANEAFGDGTSILNEYGIKNNTSAAQLEKKKKIIDDLTVSIGQRLLPIYSESIGLLGNFMKVIKALVGVLFENRSVILSLAAGIGSYIIITKTLLALEKIRNTILIKHNADTLTAVIITKTKAVADKIATAAVALHSAAVSLFSGNIKGAAQSIRIFNSVLKTSPLGWAAAAIGVVVAVVTLLSNRSNTLIKTQEDLININKKANDSYIDEKLRIEDLLRVASDKEASDIKRKEATEELQSLIPNGIELINEETLANGKAKKAVDEYCQSLLLRSKIEAGKDLLVDIEKERLNAIEDGYAGKLSFWQKVTTAVLNGAKQYGAASKYVQKTTIDNLEQFNTDYDQRSASILNNIKNWGKELGTVNTTGSNPNPNPIQPKSNDDNSKSKWSLSNDQKFSEEKIKLREKLLSAEIKTEAEFNRQLLELEVQTLGDQIKIGQEKGKDLLELKEQLVEKMYQIGKGKLAQSDAIKKLLTDSEENLFEKEYLRYQKSLENYGLSGIKKENLTTEQLAALEVLHKQHQTNIIKIETDAINKWSTKEQANQSRRLTILKTKHNNELASVTSLESAKSLLQSEYDIKDVSKIKTIGDAKKAIKAVQQKEEETETLRFYERMIQNLNNLNNGADVEGINLADNILTEEQKETLKTYIEELKLKISELNAETKDSGNESTKEGDSGGNGGGVDLFDMSEEQWKALDDNLAMGKLSIDEMIGLAGALGDIWKQYDSIVSASENARFKQFEKNNRMQKQRLQERLNSGIISQAAFTKQTEALDQEYDAKKAELELKQAKRARVTAIIEATINTAVGITSALKAGVVGIVLASIIGAMGAAQIAMILAQPLPGKEEGGRLVKREQDGQYFNAEFEPQKRGYVNKPTVIVGENGSEYVIPAEGIENPTLYPLLNALEASRLNGNMRNTDFSAVAPVMVVGGRSVGGSISLNETTTKPTPYQDSSKLEQIFISVLDVVDKLNNRLNQPISAEVALVGKNGLLEKQQEYNRIKSKAQV